MLDLQMVKLEREPENPYDHNAVRVENVLGQKVGHLPRDVARVVRMPAAHTSNLWVSYWESLLLSRQRST